MHIYKVGGIEPKPLGTIHSPLATGIHTHMLNLTRKTIFIT
jgi:hypothetical protein